MDAFEPLIRGLLAEFPAMPATVIAEGVGWTRSISVFRARVAQLRPLFAQEASRPTLGSDDSSLGVTRLLTRLSRDS